MSSPDTNTTYILLRICAAPLHGIVLTAAADLIEARPARDVRWVMTRPDYADVPTPAALFPRCTST